MTAASRETAWARRAYDVLARLRPVLLPGLLIAVVAGAVLAGTIRIDMSFRPTYTSDKAQLARTAAFEGEFGSAGFDELIAMVRLGDDANPAGLLAVHQLAERMSALPKIVAVREPLTFPFVDASGRPHPAGIAQDFAKADRQRQRALVTALLQSRTARRLIFGDGNRQVAVSATLNIPTTDFHAWRAAVQQFRTITATWSERTGIPLQITGYPEVEQVYAQEVLKSVLRSVAILVATMLVILFIYFRRLRDVVICMAGVTLAVPLVLGMMHVLGQPFSIVNSQVLVLVLIVGIAEALQHQQEYRRRREAGRDHRTANREAFGLLGWAAGMTGLATVAGFAALLTAGMKAIWSFGLCTALGVVIVYLVNWIVVPILIDVFYRKSPQSLFVQADRSWTLQALRRAERLVSRRPLFVAAAFVGCAAVLGTVGLSRISLDQKVNQELPADHPAFVAQATYEQQFTGFLGPEFWVRPASKSLIGTQAQLSAFVNAVCAIPEVRYVSSPLDFLPQPPVKPGEQICTRQPGDMKQVLAARSGRLGPELQRYASAVVSEDGRQAAVIVKVPDVGTARSIPLVHQIQRLAAQTMPGATVEPVGPWWLAQQGIQSLSFEMMFSAVTALLLILPIMLLAIRDLKLFLAAILPVVLPILAVLGFMGITGITVRIGTAMILAIALGLATDDTIHLSVRIRDRVRTGSDPSSATTATLLRTGRPASFSSYVLIAGFASMTASSLLALKDMGVVAAFTMTFALATDLLLGPAIYLLLARRRGKRRPMPEREVPLPLDLRQKVAV
jgi:predicted RND superfamily exporter protein